MAPAPVAVLELSSPTFRQGDALPEAYTQAGRNVSPPLTWNDPPPGTKSFVLLTSGVDAAHGSVTHWLVYDLPSDARSVPEGVGRAEELRDGSRQGRNDFGNIGYDGPRAARGQAHRYNFRLYAVDRRLRDLHAGMNRSEIMARLADHILATTELTVAGR